MWRATHPLLSFVLSYARIHTDSRSRPLCLGFTSEAGTLFTLPSNTTSVLVRTGVSFISSDQACSNAESEIPDFDFEATQAAARSAWNEVLGNVNVELFNGTVAGSGNGTVDAVDAGSDQEDMKVLLYSSVSLFSLRLCLPSM